MRHRCRREKTKRRLVFGTTLIAALLAMPGLADATTIPVDSTLDTTGGGICTLRDAINAANANSGFGTCPAGQPSPTVDTIDLKAVGGPTIMLTADLPLISSNLDIVGPGSALLAVDGAGLHRPFRSTSGSITDSISGLTITHGFCDTSCPGGAAGAGIFSSGTLTLTDVTVNNNTTSATGGANAFPEGGGILNNGGTVHLVLSTVTGNIASATNATSQNGPNGGGIFNNGTLTLDRSTVAANQAMANAGGVGTNAGANGGGIDHFSGTLTISRSTIIGNSVTASGASVANSAHGGGIGMANAASIALTLDRSTVTGNSVSAGSPASSQGGGGIDANGFTGSSVAVISSTISGNSAPAGAANLVPAGATRSIKNSIVSNPLGGGVNCSSTNTGSLGFNIESANSCGFNQAGDQPNTDPILDIPNGNGGPTRTMALLAGSPAIDAGLSSVGESVDQRGLSRPSDFLDIANGPGGDGTDIGAFEVQAPTPPPGPTPPGATPPDTTAPETYLSGRLRKRKRKATFTFGATEPGATFRCKLDKSAFAPCTSPVTVKHLRRGKHKFSVEAQDAAGNVDPTPATSKFKLKR